MLVLFRDWPASVARKAFKHLRRVPSMLFLVLLLGTAAQFVAWASASKDENFSSIPVGTILPIRLDKPISVKDAQPDQAIEASVMQDVPLPSGKIPMKTKAMGIVVSVVKDADGTGAKLTFKFTYLEDKKERVPILTYLRAMASFRQVLSAQMANTGGTDTGSPASWSTTILVGGDVRFGDGGNVTHYKDNVGKGVTGGVLVHILANPALGCEGPDGADALQALWVFSSNACGVYGMKEVKIAHAGKGAPVGEITLHFAKDDMKLEPGTGILLRVAPKS
jgi:hypothetical protein